MGSSIFTRNWSFSSGNYNFRKDCHFHEKKNYFFKSLILQPFVGADTKLWPSVGRINDALGDKNLVCSCPPMDTYVSPHVVNPVISPETEKELRSTQW